MEAVQPKQPQPIPLASRDPVVVKIHVQSVIKAIVDEDGKAPSRELALAVTKLQEATMWIDEHLRIS